jgi:hypothetical protein
MRRWPVLIGVAMGVLGFTACASKPEISGGALLLNMQPPPPRMAGAYDFELLDAVRGQSCVTRSADGRESSVYWFFGVPLTRLAPDALTSRAIGAAAFDAMKRTPAADSIVITRVISDGHGPDKVCATVFGRGVRLTKAAATAPASEPNRVEDADDLTKP